MSERPEPDPDHVDLDEVRRAMREHDERSEDPPEHVRRQQEPEDGDDDAP
jgi:hypothetical protein